MPELAITVGEYIGPGYVDWDQLEYVPGFTVDDIKMRLQYAEYDGVLVDSILLQFGICYGGSTRHAMDIHNYLRSLDIPVRAHVMSVTASSGTIVALAADEIELEHTAQWMVHRPLFSEGSQSQRSEDIRADADRLDREEQGMVDLYVACTGKSEEEVRALIAVDRFMSATEALAFGFATKVNPLKGKAPAAAAVQARLKAVRLAVARADKYAVRTARKPVASAKPKAKSAAKPAPTPRPMAKKVIPITAAARKAAARPAALTAQQKANANAVAALAKSLGVKAEVEGADSDPEAVVESTELDNGAFFYTDGALAEGSEVFTDEALTAAAEDGTYGTADGRDIAVAGGVVESIADTPEAEGDDETAGETPAVASLRKLIETQAKTIADLETKFSKTVPPTPRARGAVQTIDPKAPKPKAKAAHHAGL